MNILIVSQYYYPEQFRINEIAPELVRRGHKVTVLTGLPNYPSGIIPEEYRHGRRRRETIDGVEVIRCFEYGRKQGMLNLILNYLSFAVSGSIKAGKMGGKFDVILIYQLSPITMAFPALSYRRKHSVRILLYCLDLWPESARSRFKSEKNIIYRLIWKISNNIYKKCDRILVTSRPFIPYLEENFGIDQSKLGFLYQHSDTTYLNMDLSSVENGCADFMYAGNLGHEQMLDTLILAASELKNVPNFKVHIVGEGSCGEKLKELVNSTGLKDKVIFYGNKLRSEMPDMYRLADALIITLSGDNSVGKTIPGKLQTYMATGKPIFGAINGETREIISEANCGACVLANDYQGLAHIMHDFVLHRERYWSCGLNAKRYATRKFVLNSYIQAVEAELIRLTVR